MLLGALMDVQDEQDLTHRHGVSADLSRLRSLDVFEIEVPVRKCMIGRHVTFS